MAVWDLCGVWWGFYWGWMGLFPLRLLHDLWAAASGLCGSAGMRWSAVNGSLGCLPLPHIQQAMAVSRMCLALRLYSPL